MGRSVVTRLLLDPSGYLGGLKTAAAATRDFGREFDKAATTNAKGFDEVATGATVMGAGILAGFGIAAKSAMDFEKQMSSTASAAGVTGREMDALREAALKAGAETAFSATQAAKGQEELAKAGVSTRDILGGGLKGALDLASAGQLEVADAAEIAATAMTQFRLSGDKVPHVADLLSAAANKAQGSVHDVGMALKQGGLVASQFGISIEETTGALASFASAGLIGSDAGTSLKTMLMMLANPSKESAETMRRLGINAYDAQGRFVGLANLAGQLRSQLAGLTQAERDQALAQIFGADAMRAANVLYRNGAEGIRKWTNEVNDAGNAGRTAGQKLDNLAGDLEKLGGSLETQLIDTGSGANDVLRLLAQSASSAVDGFGDLPGPVQATVTVTALLTGGTLLAAGAYGMLVPKIREAQASLIAMGPAGRMANTALSGTAVVAGRALVALTALQIASTAMGKSAALSGGQVDAFADSLGQWGASGRASGSAAELLSGNLKHLNSDLQVLNSGNWNEFGTGLASTIESLTGLGHVVDDSVVHARERITSLDQALAQLVTSGNAGMAEQAFNRIAAAGREQGISLRELRAGLPEYQAALANAGQATSSAGQSMTTSAGQARVLASGLSSAVHEAGNLEKVMRGLNDVNVDAAEAGIAWRQSLSALGKEIRDNKGSTDANTQSVINRIKAGQAALTAMHAQTTATKGEAAANAQATTSHGQMRAAIIRSAVAAGLNRAAVVALVDSLFKIPSNRATNVSTPGAAKAHNEVQSVRDRIRELRDRQVRIAESGAPNAARRIADLQAQINRLQKYITVTTVYRTVGAGPGAGSVVPRQGHSADRRWGGIDYAAAGGRVEAHTVGSPTVLYGERETGGEAFVPRLGDPQRSKQILDVAASWYGYGLHKMALGGILGNSVTWGQVTPSVWNKLIAAGWRGRPGDRSERLYGSWAQLLNAGWRGRPGDHREMLYPPGSTAARAAAAPQSRADWQKGVASAAAELLRHVRRGGSVYEDLSFKGASGTVGRYNDFLADSFYSRRGDLRNRPQLERFLNSYINPGAKPPTAKPAAAKPAAKATAVTARDVAAVPAGSSFGNTGNHFTFSFSGPVGSRIELENWVTGYISDLRRQGRV